MGREKGVMKKMEEQEGVNKFFLHNLIVNSWLNNGRGKTRIKVEI